MLNKFDQAFIKDKESGIAKVGKHLATTLHIKTIAESERGVKPTMFMWKDGVYVLGAEAAIKEGVRKLLGHLATSHTMNEVLNYVRTTTYCSEKDFDAAPYLLSVRNGVLDLRTKELKPHSPEILTLVQLPVNYDKDADCPNIKRFLGEIVSPSDAPLLDEIAGYCLYRDYPVHKAFCLVGGGRNGKSTYLNLLKALLGSPNVSTRTLQQLTDNRFAVGDLMGKLANIAPDLPTSAVRHTGIFKAACGQDALTGERKFGHAFSFDNYAKLLFSANRLPKVDDDTYAFWSRWLFISFPRNFEEDGTMDSHLLARLTTEDEMSGFLNLALAAMDRVLKNGFSRSESVEAVREFFIMNSDSIKAFAEKELVYDVTAVVTKHEMYQAYVKFCERLKLAPATINAFGRDLRRSASNITDGETKIDGRSTKVWRCYKLATDTTDTTDFSYPSHMEKVNREVEKNGGNGGNGGGENLEIEDLGVVEGRQNDEDKESEYK